MGKKSTKKNHLLKKISRRSIECKPNPFEVRFNKHHDTVLGRRKKERSVPGISRSKSFKKREHSLLREYQQLNKDNCFKDRRLGENDPTVDPEERALARFAREWRKNKKRAMFNLNDEDLTHMGKSLSEINEFDDAGNSSEDEPTNLSGEFIKKAHFGGFMTMRNANTVEPERSHKDIMQEFISESKKQKFERQSEREANESLTEKLDEEWKLLQKVVAKSKHTEHNDAKKVEDSYDLTVKSLRFEIKGKPTDRLKTDDELAREEKEKLMHLEADRQKRMKGIDKMSVLKNPHISADSLEDGFVLDDDDPEKPDFDNAEAINTDSGELMCTNIESNNEVELEDDETSSSDEDIYEGMLSDNSDSENDVVVLSEDEARKMETCSKSPKSTKGAMGNDVPTTLQDLCELLSDISATEKIKLLEMLIINNHPSLGKENCKKLERLFQLLLLYIRENCLSSCFDSSMIDSLVPILYKLLQFSPVPMSKYFLDIISQERQNFAKQCNSKGQKIPSLETLIFFKLVSIFYPTSDFHHPVVTASKLFMSEILIACNVTSLQEIARGLFICSLFLEYVSYAKRFAPEAISFLKSLLPMTSFMTKASAEVYQTLLPVSEDCETSAEMPLRWLLHDSKIPVCSNTSTQILRCCLMVLTEFSKLYTDLPSFHDIFAGLEESFKFLLTNNCFRSLKVFVQQLENVLNQKTEKMSSLVVQKKAAKSLKMYEPRVQEIFTGKKQRPVMSKKKAEQQKLLSKYKKEFKGAVREIRRDNQYISRVQLNEKLERDNERKQKLRNLYQDLAQQEGEFKKFKKRRH